MDRLNVVRAQITRLNPVLLDGLVALISAGLAVAELQRQSALRDRSAINVFFVLLQTLPLLFRRRYAFTVFAVGATSLGVQGSLGFYSPTFAFLAVNLALYSLAAYGDHRLAVWGASMWTISVTLNLVTTISTTGLGVAFADPYDVFNDYVLLTAALVSGQATRQRRVRAAELEDRAARLEREREEKARQAATQERLRIARELHDVVAHSLSVIGVQAGAARLVLGSEPARAGEAVAAIEATANRAMAEMRLALGILRDTEGAAGVSLAPLPRLSQLPSLIEQMRAAGLPVDLSVQGTPRRLATSIDLSLYRIVQEGLTNSLKHAGATRAEVVVRYGDHDIELEVSDDGRGSSPSAQRSEGAGTIGMRERVALFGGSLRVGPRPQGGYSVRVCLPTAGENP